MVNYVLSFCKITGASRIFSRNFYLPLLKPLTPKEALRTFRITGKWLLGAKIQHYMPVLLNHTKKRSKRSKNFGRRSHDEMDDYTYMTPNLDSDNESHKMLLALLDNKDAKGVYVYTVEDKKYNIVLQPELEKAILDGDIIDVLVSQKNDKIIIKLKNMKKIPIEIQYYEGNKDMYCGEGATGPEEEKFHHHGKYTMSLAKIFEDKELIEEKWEEELKKIMRRRRRQIKEGSKEWKEMVKESMKNFDWQKFEEEAKKVIEEIEEPASEQDIDMEVDDLESTKNVNETFLKRGPEMLGQLPTMKEIPDIIKSMGNATLHQIETTDEDGDQSKHRVSGVKVTLPSGKECFVSGQMVHTDDGDVFVPGQTIESEFGMEYAPGITINVDNKPTLISGLIMGEEEKAPMFLPTQSTITADGQLTFANTSEERPKPQPEKQKLKKKRKADMGQISEENENQLSLEMLNGNNVDADDVILNESADISLSSDANLEYDNKSLNDVSSVELNNSEIEELDIEAMRLKQEQQRLEIEKLKAILMDDGFDEIVANLEDKKAQLRQKLEELRKLNVISETNLVTYINENETMEIASKITDDQDRINRISEILIIMTRRAATFRDKNSINADNINHACISLANPTEADVKLNSSCNKLKVLLKTAVVAANDVFKTRPKDQVLALNAICDILVDVLKQDEKVLQELVNLTATSADRNDICNAIFKQLTQNIAETKVFMLDKLAGNNVAPYDVNDSVEKILGKEGETESEAFAKISRIDPDLVPLLVTNINNELATKKVTTEEDAAAILNTIIQKTVQSLTRKNLGKVLENSGDFKEDALAFAKALGVDKVLEDLEQTRNLMRCAEHTKTFMERVLIMRQLAERDYSLKSAISRLKKNPERARSDPRIRQLIRESASLLPKKSPLRNSRDIPLPLVKTQNLLAMEDFLLQRGNVDYPVLISRNAFQAVVPKEAARGVLAGRVSYCLIDETGVTNFKPMHMFSAISVNKNREKRIEDYLSGGVRDLPERDNNRNYLQANANVRNIQKLYSNNSNNDRQVA